MAKGKKKKSKKKDAAALEENAKSLKKFLKIYEQFADGQKSVISVEISKSIRTAIEEGELFTRVRHDFSFLFTFFVDFFSEFLGVSSAKSVETE